jgi:hypothetical protein
MALDSTGNVFRPDAEAVRSGGWPGRRRPLVRMAAAFGLAAAGTAVGTVAALARRSRAERG